MKPEITRLFTKSLVTDAARRFALDADAITPLEGFENYVCESKRDGSAYIMRLSHDSHRVPDEIMAELDWLGYLAGHQVRVCRPLRSRHNQLVELLETKDGIFCAVVFERAPGKHVHRNDQTAAMTVNRGRLLGRMHALTKNYAPPAGHPRRVHWHETHDFTSARRYLKPTDTKVIERFEELVASLKSTPVDADSYGLIHVDAHTGNLFFEGNQPTLFDFDDCEYDFLISDIAISLFYAILFLPEEWKYEDYARQFLRDIWRGYSEENTLDRSWLAFIPKILKRREMILYVAIHRGFDINNLDEWGQRYMSGRRERIEQEIPVLDIDWSEFS